MMKGKGHSMELWTGTGLEDLDEVAPINITTRHRELRVRKTPAPQLEYRTRTQSEHLSDLPLLIGARRGKDRCGVLGLPLGDCREHRHQHSVYCRYHDKLQQGLTTPTAETYPVWPLPLEGYLFVGRDGKAVAA